MKKILSTKTFTLTVMIYCFTVMIFTQFANAQVIEDALRFVNTNTAPTARIGALGHSYFGFSDDASAILTNPAGLTLIPASELSFGVQNNQNTISTKFLTNTAEETKGSTHISNVQFVMPIFEPNYTPNAKLGFSYSVDNDFVANTRYSGFNTQNTFIAQQAAAGKNWVKRTGLADNWGIVLVKDNMQQDGRITETGRLHNLAFGFGIDADETFSLGATLMLKTGTYNYSKLYIETDAKNLHTTYPFGDITSLTVRDNLTQKLFGISGVVGFQVKIDEMLRLGFAVKFPTLLNCDEEFWANYVAIFDDNSRGNDATSGEQDYSIGTPYEFSFGLSGNVAGLSYSLAASYQDVSTTYFDVPFEKYDDWEDVKRWNSLIDAMKRELGGQFTLGVGLEYKIPDNPWYVRGGYTMITSPYTNKDFGGIKNIIGGGVGILLTRNLIFDASFSYSFHTEQRANYGDMDMPSLFSSYEATYTPKSFMFGFRYRFW